MSNTPTTEMVLVNMMVAMLTLPDTGEANAKAGNTGNGCVQTIRVALPAFLGVYVATFTDATHYTVTDPKNAVIGTGTTGTGFSSEGLGLVLQAGSVPFVAGDAFAIVVLPPTGAGGSVYAPRDWPVKPDFYPVILVSWTDEDKESLGPNGPQYDVVTVIRVVARVQTMPQKGDAGAAAALAAIGVLKRQIEVAVINRYALYRIINEIGNVKSRTEVKNEGEQHVGELTMDFAMKYPQLADDFAPVLTNPIGEIAIFGDLLDVADPTGTYTPPFDYAVTGEPRTVGPDGRVEAGVILELED